MPRHRMSLTPAGCVGKLRAFGDFVRHNAGGGIVEEADLWFQEGITLASQVMGRGWEAAFDGAPPATLFFRPTKGRRFLAGAWTASCDRMGRRYPFLVFTEADWSDAVPLATSRPFLHAARDLALDARNSRETRQLGDDLEKLPVDGASLELARATYSGFVHETRAWDFWTALIGSFASPVKRAIIAALAEACESWSRGKSAPSGFGIKLPLPREEAEPSPHASVWLDLAGRLLGTREDPCVVYWNTGAFFLFPGPPHPRQFLSLLRPAEEREHVWDLAASDPSVSTFPRSIDPDALEDPELLLDNWLVKLVRT